MQLYVASDIHIEFEDFVPPTIDADVVVLAGDIGVGTSGVEWAARHYPELCVIYVPGNHEYYDHDVGIIDQLKLDGRYFELLETARRKQGTLQSTGVDPDHPGVVNAQLLTWYFGQQLGAPIPQRLEDHLTRTGFDTANDFYRIITADYLYWREQDR